jgi:hypothetical protein
MAHYGQEYKLNGPLILLVGGDLASIEREVHSTHDRNS